MNIVRSITMADDGVGVGSLISLLQNSQHQLNKEIAIRYFTINWTPPVVLTGAAILIEPRGGGIDIGCKKLKSGEWAGEGLSVKESSFYADQKPLSSGDSAVLNWTASALAKVAKVASISGGLYAAGLNYFLKQKIRRQLESDSR